MNIWKILVGALLGCALSVAQADELQLYFVHNDHLGTPQVLTDTNQQVVWAADKLPFGETTVVVDGVEQNVRFPGQYFEAETGLHYNYYRDYDPSLGRYVQSDPIGIMRDYDDPQLQMAMQMGLIDDEYSAESLLNHTYGYVDQNPISFIDPWGLAGNGGDGSATGRGTNTPYKHCKPHPTDPNKLICKDKKTGKKKVVPMPSDYKNSMTCGSGCKAGMVMVGGVCLALLCASNPIICGLGAGGALLTN